MGNFCNVASFNLCLLICKFVTFVVRLKKASAEKSQMTLLRDDILKKPGFQL